MTSITSMSAFLSRPVADFILEEGETDSSQRIIAFCNAAHFVDVCDLVRYHNEPLPEEMLQPEDYQLLRQRLAAHDMRLCFGPGAQPRIPAHP